MKANVPRLPSKFSFISTRLADMLDSRHPLFRLADQIEWERFDTAFEPMFCADTGPRRSARGWWWDCIISNMPST